jgi:hypothetical protein
VPKKKDCNSDTAANAKLESGAGDAPLSAKEAKGHAPHCGGDLDASRLGLAGKAEGGEEDGLLSGFQEYVPGSYSPEKGQEGLGRVRIHWHHVRLRELDMDNLCCKAVTDAVVRSGLIKDDKTAYVESVTHTQQVGSVEKTIMYIEEV